MPYKLVIMDRDGTINADSDEFIKSPEEWQPLPGALEAIAKLNHAGWHVVVATNQPGLGRGSFDVGTLNAIHTKMNKALAAVGGRVEAVFYCPHAAEDHCDCAKPAPGLFFQIGERFGVDLDQVPVVGDRLRDVEAGAKAGCQPHLVLSGEAGRELRAAGAQRALPSGYPPDTQVHEDLMAFARHLLKREVRPASEPAKT